MGVDLHKTRHSLFYHPSPLHPRRNRVGVGHFSSSDHKTLSGFLLFTLVCVGEVETSVLRENRDEENGRKGKRESGGGTNPTTRTVSSKFTETITFELKGVYTRTFILVPSIA